MGHLSRLNFKHLIPPMVRHKNRFVKLWNYQPFRTVNRRLFGLDSSRLLLIPPSDQPLQAAGNLIPYSIVEHFVREASHRVILHHCPCRAAFHCRDFDPGFGCTFLGEGARDRPCHRKARRYR